MYIYTYILIRIVLYLSETKNRIQLVALNSKCSFYTYKTCVSVQTYHFFYIYNMTKLTLKVLKT